jgi:L-gulonolactone oxidase
MWRNWSGEQACRPQTLARPRDTGEVVAAVRAARDAGHPLRVAGAGHSFTALVPTTGTLLSLERMAAVLHADRATGRVRVQAGITLAVLGDVLAQRGLAVENLGDINAQSLAGACATATHGTGARLGNLSSQVVGMTIVAGDGSVVTLDGDDEGLRAARVSLGALGVVTEIELSCVPAFTLRGVDAPRALDETLARFEELCDAAEHFEFFVFPHDATALTRTNTRVDGPPSPPGAARRWLEDVLVGNGVLGAVCRAGRARPAAVPALNRLLTRAASTTRVRVDRSDRVFASPRHVRFVEMEYALPRAAAVDALRAVKAVAERHAINFPLEVRTVAADDALLSPASGRDSVYIAVHAYRGMPWEPFFREVEAIADAHDGRPHWGKRHFQTAKTLRPRYRGWDAFARVRDRLDPERRCTTPYVASLLGP